MKKPRSNQRHPNNRIAVLAPRVPEAMKTPDSPAELRISKTMGSELLAAEHAAAYARSVGFTGDRIADIRTAVGEAALNAIEHASPHDINDTLTVAVFLERNTLKVSIASKGSPFTPTEMKPDIKAKVEGRDRPRGWGIYLMKQLADTVEFSFANELATVTLTFQLRDTHHTIHNV